MSSFDRISLDPQVTCIRGLRVTGGMIVGLVRSGKSPEHVLEAFPYLEREDIQQALAYDARK